MPIVEIIFVAPIIPLVSIIPIGLNGIGLTEGAYVLFYTQAWLTPYEAFAAALIRRLLVTLVSLFGGILWIVEKRKTCHENA
jgi:hypothetical protein